MKRVQIVGTQRSGSNLLRLLLGSLPGVFAPPSAHKLRDFQGLLPRYGEPLNMERLIADMAELVELNALPWPSVGDRTRIVLEEMQGIVARPCLFGLLRRACPISGEANLGEQVFGKCSLH